jgi:hypothetical protein
VSDIVVLATFASDAEAEIAQAVLEANGVPSTIIRDNAGGMMPWLQWLHPVRLAVRADDERLARELLEPGGEVSDEEDDVDEW